MLIYRIESRDGHGAFGAGLAYEHDDHRHRNYRRSAYSHPGPSCEGGPMADLFNYGRGGNPDDYYFGCRSKTQLRSWFGSKPGRRAMAKAGGVMVTYEVPDDAVVKGSTQIAFVKSRATVVSSVPADQW
ncbi:hypothetical protein GOB43_17930 [Sinorhizobium meliloti]|uniref:hypothetical protein n=1 Tax=Rhizobium meliloti TaxID=382 RepID=UPI000FDC8767|nr:hypothetical protein [Sinorhizobium meliloti]MDW9519144.1 hypothetical protein [Sinorhizobium meliloti]MDX0194071.1 hypothetical protein [Sinorhizobium meliloti]RVJ51470.1 hypothetical protein CN175_15990 [Sinorhizobium meliloti]